MSNKFLELASKHVINTDHVQAVTNVQPVVILKGTIYKATQDQIEKKPDDIRYGFRIDLIGTSVWVFGSDTKNKDMAQQQRVSLISKLTA